MGSISNSPRSCEIGAMHSNMPMNSGNSMQPSQMQNSISIQGNISAGQMQTSTPKSPRRTVQVPAGDGKGKDPVLNEAMEKLCESMRRSAMSRSLVKQLSGLNRQNSSRSLNRSNSGVGVSNLRKQLSGRNLRRTTSAKVSDGTSRSNLPIRRTDAKHRIQRETVESRQAVPGRGVFRNNSSHSGLIGKKTVLELDEKPFGTF